MVDELEKIRLNEELKDLESNPIILLSSSHICSDGTIVSIDTNNTNIRYRMRHLSEEEILPIIETSTKRKALKMRIGAVKKRLYGEEYTINYEWNKCKEERNEEMLVLFGKMYSAVEVHKIVTTEWGYKRINYERLLQYQRDNVNEIEKLREEYQKNTDNIRLVHKKARLDELTDMYIGMKIKHSETNHRDDYKLLMVTLEQIRKEVEGQRLTIDGKIEIEHTQAIQDHVNREILKNLNINDIIVSRLCSRLNVNPKYIMHRLHNSYYSKFTGFLPRATGDEEDPMYPSQIIYDFTSIEEKNKNLLIQDVEYKEVVEEVKEVELPKVNLLQELLKKKLEEKKLELKNEEKLSKDSQGLTIPHPSNRNDTGKIRKAEEIRKQKKQDKKKKK